MIEYNSAMMIHATQRFLARGDDRGVESKDCAVLSLLHSAVRKPRQRTRLCSIFGAGEHFSCAEHVCGFDGNRPGWPAWKPHSYFRQVPSAAEDGDWRNHDRIGNLPCDQREVITMK